MIVYLSRLLSVASIKQRYATRFNDGVALVQALFIGNMKLFAADRLEMVKNQQFQDVAFTYRRKTRLLVSKLLK